MYDIKIKVEGVEFDVSYRMSGLGDDAELDEVSIFVRGEEVSAVLSDRVLHEIDDKIFEDFWKAGQEAPEVDDE